MICWAEDLNFKKGSLSKRASFLPINYSLGTSVHICPETVVASNSLEKGGDTDNKEHQAFGMSSFSTY